MSSGITNQDLADVYGVSLRTFMRWLVDKSHPSDMKNVDKVLSWVAGKKHKPKKINNKEEAKKKMIALIGQEEARKKKEIEAGEEYDDPITREKYKKIQLEVSKLSHEMDILTDQVIDKSKHDEICASLTRVFFSALEENDEPFSEECSGQDVSEIMNSRRKERDAIRTQIKNELEKEL